jgi:methionine-rich copper-binding protein CopC
MRVLLRSTLSVGALVLAGTAVGHADLAHATPAPGTTHVGDLDAVTLAFTMPIEARFSRFDLYRLDLPPDAQPFDLGALTEREAQRLSALAGALVTELRGDSDAADAVRVPIAVTPGDGRATEVTLAADTPLPGGAYVVAWEVLAGDGHTTRGHFVFLVVDAS